MKKILFALGILGIALAIYFYLTQGKESKYTDIQTVTNPVVFKPENQREPQIQHPEPTQKIIKVKDENFDSYDQLEKEWLTQAENIMGARDFEFYADLRSRNEEEKMQAYKEFHDYLRKKNGDNFSYHLSEDQSIREKSINTKYSRELLKRLGDEKFKAYLKARDQFNETQARKSTNGQALLIEF